MLAVVLAGQLSVIALTHTPARRCRHAPASARAAVVALGGDLRPDDSSEDGERQVALPLTLQRSVAPISSRSTLSLTDAGTLVLDVPARGFGTESFFSGAFSVAWFSTIARATFTGGAPLLFMLPFWAAGGVVAKSAALDPFVSSQLSIGQFGWTLRSTAYAGAVPVAQYEGATAELRGARAEVASDVNGVQQRELRLYWAGGQASLGLALGEEELEYLAAEINAHVEELRARDGGDGGVG